ncbi:MAG: Riboflavin kinase, partial [Candidatus Parcubacteria bacterium]
MGFPTANIALHTLIPEGIYLSSVFLKGKRYCALTFIGKAETFKNAIYQSETFL